MADAGKLIVVLAFDPDPESGELLPAIEPIQADSEDRAIRTARSLADKHAGVVAWARRAQPDVGEYGEPEVLFQSGELGEID